MTTLIQLKQTTSVFLIGLGLACFWLSPAVQAVSPAPDGGYPGGNTAEGQNALLSLTTGGFNTAVGFFSLRTDTTNSFNTAIGAGTLLTNTADQNTATGAGALLSNTTGGFNTANGAFSLFSNTTGGFNTASGASALRANTGDGNTANGSFALQANTTGGANTANGASALFSNTTGASNTATGWQALHSNIDGENNTTSGVNAMYHNDHGNDNTAYGFSSLTLNTSGSGNTAIGDDSLDFNTTGCCNTANGAEALNSSATGSFNTALGFSAGLGVTTASNVICIGTPGANVSNTTWIGNIYNTTTVSGTTLPVIVSDSGQLGTASSSRRFKKEIKPMDKASEVISALKPVTFHYKSDKTNRPEFGLIAEDVAKVNPDLVVRDKNGEIYTVRYDAVNAMLLNEFLKEHRKVQALEAAAAQERKDSEATAVRQQKQIAALTAGLQKVSAQLEMSRPAPQTVKKTD